MGLGDLAWLVKDGPHHSPRYVDQGIPFISGRNVRPDGVDFASAKYITPTLHEELSRRCVPELGDVLYTKGGTTGIARVNTYRSPFNVWVHVAVLKLVGSVRPFFVQHMLNAPQCYRQAQLYTHGVGNQDLGLTRMIRIVMPMAPPAEQDVIVQRVDAHMAAVKRIEEAMRCAQEGALHLDPAILAKAFRGELTNGASHD